MRSRAHADKPILPYRTGASGYIGGEALYALVKSHPEYYIRALVRDAVKGHAISSAFPSVQVVEGNLDDASILAAEVSRADVVLRKCPSSSPRTSLTLNRPHQNALRAFQALICFLS